VKSAKTVYIAAGVIILAGALWFFFGSGGTPADLAGETGTVLKLDDENGGAVESPSSGSLDALDGSSAEVESAGIADDETVADDEPGTTGEGNHGAPITMDAEINTEVLNFEIPQDGDELQKMDRTFDVLQRAVLYLKETKVILPQATADKLVRLAREAYLVDKSDYAPSLIANLLPEYETEIRAAMQTAADAAGAQQFTKAFENIHRLD
jgi:hypothetical protein